MAPTLNSVVLGSRLAERWFAHSERTQSSQPLEGSSFTHVDSDTNPFTNPSIARRSDSDPTSTRGHSHIVSTVALATILGSTLAFSLCSFSPSSGAVRSVH